MTHDELGSALASMTYEQRTATLELIGIVAFACTSTGFPFFPIGDADKIAERVAERVAEQFDELADAKPNADAVRRVSLKDTHDSSVAIAEEEVRQAQRHREQTYSIYAMKSRSIYGDPRDFADRRLANAQEALVKARQTER